MSESFYCPIYCAEESAIKTCTLLAKKLGQDVLSCPPAHDNYLFVDKSGISICCKLHNKRVTFQVDFMHGKNAHRSAHGGGYKQLIAKACGLKANAPLKILDLTAGFGKDAFVLADLGAEVTMVEKNPYVHALLQDGLARLAQETTLPMRLIEMDSQDFLGECDQSFDVLYLDPMFDEVDYGAQVKKDLQILRILAKSNDNAELLFEKSQKTKTKRIVVKRHRHASPITSAPYHHQILGKSTRYDVYSNLSEA